MKYMKKRLQNLKITERIERARKAKEAVDNTQKIIDEVDTITKVISSTLYIRGNVAIDLQNYSLISVSDLKDIQ
jgi:hypothetical protein